MPYTDKYNLTQEENLFLAKKTLVENIYSQAKMENINITFPDTKTIIDGMSISGLKADDVQKVLNLRNAWQYTLANINEPLTLDYAKQVHAMVAYGELPPTMLNTLRNGDVGIGGSFYQPIIPNEKESSQQIKNILQSDVSMTEKALDYFLFACRSQLFWDGNKRTASICANKILIGGGVGVMIIDEKHLRRFNKLMIDFYETADKTKIKQFLYTNCIFGINY
ncbi:Fic family protein [Enterococcus sp. PF1-24]|uniref:Fic family protein n=1 Tax=unclassified Enterococcus TaxID=2608891 RepID=UPI0024738AA6|nr:MULTISPECIES: Fic family protein [unclassified Enterococcus]MDH6364710.1 Fic family protein [Enterococcus sp. PFB1-1]MDH6401814.1 Fic family protein [Enterococcus sp. PF1-24]